MDLCLDFGNTSIFVGLFDERKCIFKFRFALSSFTDIEKIGSSIYHKITTRFEKIKVRKVHVCSVTKIKKTEITQFCIKYFYCKPVYLTHESTLSIKVSNYQDKALGLDRIANAVAASKDYPDENLVIFDFGTATTICFVDKNKNHLGGLITPGIATSFKALSSNTANLSETQLKQPIEFIGKSTQQGIQSGIYFSHVALVEKTKSYAKNNLFKNSFKTIATGGFALSLQKECKFDVLRDDLILYGLLYTSQ